MFCVKGSPPPMRGKGVSGFSLTSVSRITPAYAGKSVAQAALNVIMRDHPRLCGEKSFPKESAAVSSGSPSPMRGKDAFIRIYHPKCDITPAYAGKRCTHRQARGCSGDHPRLCGEKFAVVIDVLAGYGSPPPMRGKGDTQHFAHLSHGITPAYAGKSRRHLKLLLETEDHPRLCGEKPPLHWRRWRN